MASVLKSHWFLYSLTAVVSFVGGLSAFSMTRGDWGPYAEYEGVWVNGFELSRFETAGPSTPQNKIWLDVDRASSRLILRLLKIQHVGAEGCRFQVRFSGNPVTGVGGFGHLGMSDGEIVFRELHSIRLLNGADAPAQRSMVVTDSSATVIAPPTTTTCP